VVSNILGAGKTSQKQLKKAETSIRRQGFSRIWERKAWAGMKLFVRGGGVKKVSDETQKDSDNQAHPTFAKKEQHGGTQGHLLLWR